jgi:hypothetical protein
MPLLASTRSLLRNLLSSRRVDGELDQEVRAHWDLLTDENIRPGMSPQQARRVARIELGGIEQVKEQVRRPTLWELAPFGAQCTREIGIRVALRAQSKSVPQMVLKEGLSLAILGVVMGLATSFVLTRLMISLLFAVKPTDPLTFAAVATTLLLQLSRRAGCRHVERPASTPSSRYATNRLSHKSCHDDRFALRRSASPPVSSPANPFPASPPLERLRFLCGPWPSTLSISPATVRRPKLDCAGPPYTKRAHSPRAVPRFQRMHPLPLRTKTVRGPSLRSSQTFFASEARSLCPSLCCQFILFESSTRAGEHTASLNAPSLGTCGKNL